MYYDALMLKKGNLTKAEKEIIVVATSSANNCMYCIVAHGALLRIYSKNPLLGDQVKTPFLFVSVIKGVWVGESRDTETQGRWVGES